MKRQRFILSTFLVSIVLLALLLSSGARLTVVTQAQPRPTTTLGELPGAADDPIFASPLSGGPIVYSSPTLADIDYPANNTKEILFGGEDGMLYVYNSDGSLNWSVNTGSPVNSSPSVGDLDGNGDMEVVVSLGGQIASTQTWHGGVVAYHHDGTPYWTFRTQDDVPADGWSNGVWATPALGDVDGDGKMEIAFGSWDRNMYLLNYDGTQRWMFHNADTFWSSAALADLDQDGDLEIITGADYAPGGYFYIFDKDGTVLVQEYIGQTIMSSPAIGDIDGDSYFDSVVGTGSYAAAAEPGHYLNAWDRSGKYLNNWPRPTGGRVVSSPAIADLDGDGSLEAVVSCEDGKLYAWNGDGSAVPGWPMTPMTQLGATQNFNLESPTVADYDGDGQVEVLMSIGWEIAVIGANGVQETTSAGPTYSANYTLRGSPAVGDIDNDGYLEMVIAGGSYSDQTHGYLYAWRTGLANQAALPWPMFHHDAQHTGLLSTAANQPLLSVSPDSMTIMHPYGRPSSSSVFVVENKGVGTIEWTSSLSPAASAPVTVTLDPASGTVAETSQTAVTAMVTGLVTVPMGSHNLGRVTISGTANGAAVDGSPQTVDLTLQVGSVVWLPPIMK